MPGEALGCRALIAFQRKAETPALARCWESGTGAKKLAAQASSEDCDGHL